MSDSLVRVGRSPVQISAQTRSFFTGEISVKDHPASLHHFAITVYIRFFIRLRCLRLIVDRKSVLNKLRCTREVPKILIKNVIVVYFFGNLQPHRYNLQCNSRAATTAVKQKISTQASTLCFSFYRAQVGKLAPSGKLPRSESRSKC